MKLLIAPILISFVQPLWAKDIRFVWNTYCPYTCDLQTNENPGLAMEIVRLAFKDSPYQVSFKHADSWNLAMKQVKKGMYDAIVFSFHVDNVHRDYVVPEQSMAIENSTNFMVKKSNPWQLVDIDSLSELKHIGAYKNTVWGNQQVAEFEDRNPSKFTYLQGEDIFLRALKMVRLGRLDTWEDSLNLLNYKIYKYGITDMRVERLVNKAVSVGGALFSKHNGYSPEYANYLSQQIIKMRKNGEFDRILAKYGLDSEQQQRLSKR